MAKRKTLIILAAAGAAFVALPAAAHFILMEPNSWIVENQLGDPQKNGPCGESANKANPITATNAVTAAKGGDTIHLKVKETIYHPGFFRVALSVQNRSELPADPEATTKDGPRGPLSVSGKTDPNPKPPVLLDNLFNHHERMPQQVFETDVKLPNINCAHCTLQVIQFMEEHGENPEGRFTYHHCADLKITANPAMPIDKRWPGQG